MSSPAADAIFLHVNVLVFYPALFEIAFPLPFGVETLGLTKNLNIHCCLLALGRGFFSLAYHILFQTQPPKYIYFFRFSSAVFA